MQFLIPFTSRVMERGSDSVQQWRTNFSLNETSALRKCQLHITPLPSQTPFIHMQHSGHSPIIGCSNATNILLTPPPSSSPLTPQRRKYRATYKPLSPCSTFPLSPSSKSKSRTSYLKPCNPEKGSASNDRNDRTNNRPVTPRISTATVPLNAATQQASTIQSTISVTQQQPCAVQTSYYEPPPPPSKHITATPIFVAMKYPQAIVEDYEKYIEHLCSKVAELESTISIQAREIRSLRKNPIALSNVSNSSNLSISSNSKSSDSDKQINTNTNNNNFDTKTQEINEIQITTTTNNTAPKNITTFDKGKTGIFERLTKHAKVKIHRQNMEWSELQKIRNKEKRTGRARHGKIPRDQFINKDLNVVKYMHTDTNTKQHRATKRDPEFKANELSSVAALYNEMSQMAVANLTDAEGAHKRTKHKHRIFWLSDRHTHPLTTSSSDVCMVQENPQLLPLAFTNHLPQMLSYLECNDLENVGLVCQQLLLFSHHVHVVAYKAEYLMDRMEPLAKCWSIVIGNQNEHIEATELLVRATKPAQYVELRRVHKPSVILVDIIMTLGVLLCPKDNRWNTVHVDRNCIRKKSFGGKRDKRWDTKKRVMVGANWSHCQQLVLHVEQDGHMLPLLKRIQLFDPDKMSRKTIGVLRGVIKSGILKSKIAARGGTLAASVAKWIVGVTHHALALDRMKMLGGSHRIDFVRGGDIIEEAKWHEIMRRKMNDGVMRMFFGWQ